MEPDPVAATLYCRKCGYALVGLSENRCPECGRGFDPANRKTFARSAQLWWIRRWVKRAALAIGCLVAVCLLVVVAVLGPLYWHWKAEQPLIAAIRQQGGTPQLQDLGDPSDRRLFFKVFSPGLPLHESPSWIAQVFLNLSRRVISVEYTNASRTGEDLGILADLQWLHSVTFAGTHLDNNALAPLERAARVDLLAFYNMTLSRDNLACIGRMRHLEALIFLGVSLDGADLVSLQQLPALRHLSVEGGKVDDAALEQIGKITALTQLFISQPKITDEGLRHLSGLARLERLSIDSARITGSGLVYLKDLPALRELQLAQCTIVDEGLASLKDWPSLETLDLQQTLITDAAAKHLAAARTLKGVSVSKTKMHDASQWLRDARPDLVVYGDAWRLQRPPG